MSIYTVIAKRWFDSAWGNTYHSCQVFQDNKLMGATPFSYGYDDQYKLTAHELYQTAGLFTDIDYIEFTRNQGIKFNVSDVKTKRQLDTKDTTKKA